MPKVRVVFPTISTLLVGWVVDTVLAVTPSFEGIRWGEPVGQDDVDPAIFIADVPGEGQINPHLIRRAIRTGVNVFVVTGEEGTVSPADLGEIAERGNIYFFHARKSTAEDGFLPFEALGPAIQHVLSGLPLADFGKEE